MNSNGVVLCNSDIPARYLVASDVHPRSVLRDQAYPGEIIRRNRQSSGAAASSSMPTANVYQPPLSTSERRTERAAVTTPVEPAAPAALPHAPPLEAVTDTTGDIFVARWLKDNGIKSSLIRELHAIHPLPIDLIDEPEVETAGTTVADAQAPVVVVFEDEIVFEGEEDKEPELSSDDVRRVLEEAQQDVRAKRDEESKKRQKKREKEEREETRSKKAKEVHEFLNTAPSGSAAFDTKLIQAYLQEAEEHRGPTSAFSFEPNTDNFGEPVPVYRSLADLPFEISHPNTTEGHGLRQ
eukprot:4889987-Amphidinium_carterae.5